MCDIDNKSYKVIKEIYDHSSCTKDHLIKKFKTDLKDELDLLLLKQLVDNPVVGYDGDNNLIYDYETFFITQPGRAYIDYRTRDDRRWKIPVIISIIALTFSLVVLLPQLPVIIELILKLLMRL